MVGEEEVEGRRGEKEGGRRNPSLGLHFYASSFVLMIMQLMDQSKQVCVFSLYINLNVP